MIIFNGDEVIFEDNNYFRSNGKYFSDSTIRPPDGWILHNSNFIRTNKEVPIIIERDGLYFILTGFDDVDESTGDFTPIYTPIVYSTFQTKDFENCLWVKASVGRAYSTRFEELKKNVEYIVWNAKYDGYPVIVYYYNEKFIAVLFTNTGVYRREIGERDVIKFMYGNYPFREDEWEYWFEVPGKLVYPSRNSFEKRNNITYKTSQIETSFKLYGRMTIQVVRMSDGQEIFHITDNPHRAFQSYIEREAIKDKPKSIRLMSVAEKVKPVIHSRYSGDPIELLQKIMKQKTFFGPLIAHPSKKTIVTKKGIIVLHSTKRKEFDKKELEAIKYVLGIKSEFDVLHNKPIEVRVYKKKVDITLSKQNYKPLHINNRLFLWNTLGSVYESVANIVISDFVDPMRYNKNTNTIRISPLVRLPVQTIEKLTNGKNIGIHDILPGFPTEKAEIPEILEEDTYITVGIKTLSILSMKLSFEKDYLVVHIPYVEGVYELHIPYDNTIDVWTPKSVRDIPAEYVSKVHISTGLQSDEGITEIFLKNAYSGHGWSEFILRTEKNSITFDQKSESISITGKAFYKRFTGERAYVLRKAKTIYEMIGMATML